MRTWWQRVLTVVSVVTLTTTGAVLAPAASAAAGCADHGDVLVPAASPFRTVIVDCSSGADADQLARLLAGTDAARLGLLDGRDRFLANDEFVLWIDTHSAPGILRGLWPVTPEGVSRGTTRPGTGGHQSLLHVGDQYHVGASDTLGYLGLHVEVWTAPQEAGGDYFTYRREGARRGDYLTTADRSTANFDMQLFSRRSQGTSGRFVGHSGGVAERVSFGVTYTVTPQVVHIETRLGADGAVDTRGDLGGLLLLTTQACAPTNASCEATIRDHSLHVLASPDAGDEGVGCTPTTGEVTVLGAGGRAATWDMYGLPFSAATRDQDRYCIDQALPAPGQDTSMDPVRLSSAPGSEFGMTLTPQLHFGDPYATQQHRQVAAYHFNATPAGIGALGGSGVTGLGSYDVVFQPADRATTTLAFGGARGYRTFAVDIDR